jgi:hypothetical protein
MNTVRLRRPDQPYDAFDGPGRDLLLAALGRRIDLAQLLPDSRARDRLVTASGGAIRELLSLVEGWYDVLPLLTELPEFQHASQRLPARS